MNENENVLVPLEDLQRILDYVFNREYDSYENSIKEGLSVENHIYTVYQNLQNCVDSQ
jgi:hypothetical protein